jgi:hypothetical protein
VAAFIVGFQAGVMSARTDAPMAGARAMPLVARSRIMLPGVFGRIDHFGLDGRRGNIFICALGNDTVEVVNNLKVVHTIRGLGHPQAALYVEEFDRLVVSAKDGKLRFFDGGTFAPLKILDFGSDTDNLRYEPVEKRVYVAYGEGAIAMVDAASMQRLPAEFAVGSHPESFQFERSGTRIFVSLPDQEAIGVIERKSGTISKWPVAGSRTNHALAFDEAGHRLFSAALQPGKLWVLDSDSGRIVATLRIVVGVDDLWFDARRKRVLASGHAGFISVVQQRTPDEYELVADVATAVGAGTSLYVRSRTSEGLYVGAPNISQEGSQVLFLAIQDEGA